MKPADKSRPSQDQIDVDALFEAQEKERRRRRRWIAAALVGVVAAGAVTGGVVTGAFTGDDADADAAGAPEDLGATESAGTEPAETESSDSEAPAPEALAPEDPAPEVEAPESAGGEGAPAPGAEESPGGEDAAPAPAESESGQDEQPAGDQPGAGAPEPGAEGSASADGEEAPGSPPSAGTGDDAPSPAEQAPAPTSYQVTSGDTLWSITESVLPGDPSEQAIKDAWPTIYQANEAVFGGSPSVLPSGVRLTVPDLGATGGGGAPATPEAGGTRQVVAPGESLWSITDAALGGNATADQVLESWPKVYEANRQVIGDDPDLIRVGQELVVPALP